MVENKQRLLTQRWPYLNLILCTKVSIIRCHQKERQLTFVYFHYHICYDFNMYAYVFLFCFQLIQRCSREKVRSTFSIPTWQRARRRVILPCSTQIQEANISIWFARSFVIKRSIIFTYTGIYLPFFVQEYIFKKVVLFY